MKFQVIKKFRDDELEHLETGIEYDGEKVRSNFIFLLRLPQIHVMLTLTSEFRGEDRFDELQCWINF